MQNADFPDDSYFGLAEILRILGRRWRWLVGTIIVITALALALSFQESPKYQAHAKLLLHTVANDASFQSDPNAKIPYYADREVQNAIQVIQSSAVKSLVEKSYKGNLSVGKVTATQATAGADALDLAVTSRNPKDAATLVNLYAEQYIKFTQSERLDSLQSANTQIQDRLDQLNDQRTKLAQPLTSVTGQLTQQPTNASLLEQQAVLSAQLKPELDAIDNQIQFYVQEQENLALSSGLTPLSVADVLSRATAPDTPVAPKPIRNGIIGFMAGTGLGLVLALAREFLDQSIRTTDDLERTVKGRLPILGVIPEASASEIAALPAVGDHSAVAEAYRALRTSVRFEGLDRPMKVIQITSSSASEGKTTTAANLARMLAQDGHRVAVVCCDLRRPTIHELFGVRVSPGLADVVLGTQALASAITQTDSQTFMLPAGSAPPNPSELLGSSRAEAVIEALANEMDYVIIDTTPVLPVTDAIVVSRFADATILVVNAGDTTRNQLHQALTQLEQASAPTVGLVLNRAFGGDRYAYGYGYGYGYENQAGRSKGKSGNGSSNGSKGEALPVGDRDSISLS